MARSLDSVMWKSLVTLTSGAVAWLEGLEGRIGERDPRSSKCGAGTSSPDDLARELVRNSESHASEAAF